MANLLAGLYRTFTPETNDYDRQHPMPAYKDDQDLIAATFAALERPRAHLAAQGAVPVIHWVTHADALVALSECGYPEIARRGYQAHQTFINRAVTETDASPAPATPVSR